MKITVCIGSSCHLKGSKPIVEELQKLIGEKDLGEKIQIAGAFCMGNCVNGVSVKLDEELFSVQPETVRDFFEKEVLPRV